MTAYIVDPAVTLYDVSGSLFGVQGNPVFVTGSFNITAPAVQVISGTVDEFEEKSFYAIVTGSLTGSNKSMFSIFNDLGSGVNIKVYGLWIVNVQTTAVAGIVSTFELRRIAGHISGSIVSPVEMDTLDSMNASVTLRTNSIVLGESPTLLSRYLWSSDEWGPGSEDVESTQATMQTLMPIWSRIDKKLKPLTLRSGQGLTVKHVVNSANGKFDIHVSFSQV